MPRFVEKKAVIVAAGLIVASTGMPAAAQPAPPATPLVLKSVSVELPGSDRMLPDGPGSDTINNNCLACHSAGMILTQPVLSKDAWAAEVRKMIAVYKAPVSDQDAAVIIAYLGTMKAVR